MSLSLLLCQLLVVIQGSCASQIDVPSEIENAHGNKTILKTQLAPSWVPALFFRSTFDLLRLCFFTLLLCVYTTIHLNIPSRHPPWYVPDWIRLKYLVIAALAPDLLVYSASWQFFCAWKLKKGLNKIYKARKENGTSDVKYKRL
jgi:hypothetical protein